MPDLKITITIVEIIIAASALVVSGDYPGYKAGHRRTARLVGILAGVVDCSFCDIRGRLFGAYSLNL